jgi:hypothetical protein
VGKDECGGFGSEFDRFFAYLAPDDRQNYVRVVKERLQQEAAGSRRQG